jgi:hypothetical protein
MVTSLLEIPWSSSVSPKKLSSTFSENKSVLVFLPADSENPLAIGTHTRTIHIVNEDNDIAIKLFGRGVYGGHDVDFTLITDDKKFGPCRSHNFSRTRLPIPKIIIRRHQKFSFIVDLHAKSEITNLVGIYIDYTVEKIVEEE